MNAIESRQFRAWTEYIVGFLSRQPERTVLLVQEYRAWPLGGQPAAPSQTRQCAPRPRRCHPERSAAKPKDLLLAPVAAITVLQLPYTGAMPQSSFFLKKKPPSTELVR